MSQPIPPGHDGLIPHLICDPCAAALAFYEQAFGATLVHRLLMPGTSKILHAAVLIDGRPLFLADDHPEFCGGKSLSPQSLGGSPVSIHRYVEDCDAAIERAKTAGATVTMPAQDMFWGDRYGVVVDPFGHTWAFATRIRELTPEEMLKATEAAFSEPSAAPRG